MSDTTLSPETTRAHGVTLTDAAATKVKNLLEQEGRDDLRLRVAVQPGGCSGLIYLARSICLDSGGCVYLYLRQFHSCRGG